MIFTYEGFLESFQLDMEMRCGKVFLFNPQKLELIEYTVIDGACQKMQVLFFLKIVSFVVVRVRSYAWYYQESHGT